MATLKDRIDKMVSSYEKTQKSTVAAEAVKRYNETISKLAKNVREMKD